MLQRRASYGAAACSVIRPEIASESPAPTSSKSVNARPHTLRPSSSAAASDAWLMAVRPAAAPALRRAALGKLAPSALLTRTEAAQLSPIGSM